MRKEVPQLPVEPVEPLKEDGPGGVETAKCVVWNVVDFKQIYIYIYVSVACHLHTRAWLACELSVHPPTSPVVAAWVSGLLGWKPKRIWLLQVVGL